jgi:hypothetical protein
MYIYMCLHVEMPTSCISPAVCSDGTDDVMIFRVYRNRITSQRRYTHVTPLILASEASIKDV